MPQNSTQPLFNGDEMDLLEIVKILLKSKKLIISTILIFTTASIIYSLSQDSSFKSSAKFEIGYFLTPDGKYNLIEEPADLISELNIMLLKTSNELRQKVSINLIDKKLINLETTSSSVEENDYILNEMISYIDERHSRLEKLRAEQRKSKISLNIETTKAEINHVTEQLSSKYLSQYLDIISNLEKKEKAIQTLKLLDKNSSQAERLFSLNQKLKILILNQENLDSEVKSESKIIGNIETNEIKTKYLLIISMSIFFGFITSILLVFINNFLKNVRQSET